MDILHSLAIKPANTFHPAPHKYVCDSPEIRERASHWFSKIQPFLISHSNLLISWELVRLQQNVLMIHVVVFDFTNLRLACKTKIQTWHSWYCKRQIKQPTTTSESQARNMTHHVYIVYMCTFIHVYMYTAHTYIHTLYSIHCIHGIQHSWAEPRNYELVEPPPCSTLFHSGTFCSGTHPLHTPSGTRTPFPFPVEPTTPFP